MGRRDGLGAIREHAFKLSRLAAEFEPAIRRHYPTDERAARIVELARSMREVVLLIDELNREEAAQQPPPPDDPRIWPGVNPNAPEPPAPPPVDPISPRTWPGSHSNG